MINKKPLLSLDDALVGGLPDPLMLLAKDREGLSEDTVYRPTSSSSKELLEIGETFRSDVSWMNVTALKSLLNFELMGIVSKPDTDKVVKAFSDSGKLVERTKDSLSEVQLERVMRAVGDIPNGVKKSRSFR